MCGRFALDATEDALMRHFSLKQGFKMASRYNIAPSTIIPVIRDNPAKLEFLNWGFIPRWSKDENPKGHINARAETIDEKPTFKAAMKTTRCLIPASGYYEWMKIQDKKQPYYITVQDKPIIAFAGIWGAWRSPEHEVIETAAVLTVQANDEIARVHNRMP
jgi:putative SOS response-associated peptidase YedK